MRATLEEVFYNVDVTTADMLVAVGQALQRIRLDKKWKPIDVERADGPSYKTVQTIEEGNAGHVESLDKCARALGVEIVDILYSVLESRVKPLTPEASMIVRVFNETTVEMRTTFVALANAAKVLQAHEQQAQKFHEFAEAIGASPKPAGETTPPTPRPPRPAPKATRRRTAR